MTVDARIGLGYADVGEVKLHYATAGSGERLVLLLHGFPEFWYSWRHQLVALSDTYTVVAPDLRGYNLSERPERIGEYSLEKLANDIRGLVQHFGRKDAAIVGHDWGAAVAWATAVRHPDVVWKLIALQVPPASVWKRNQTFKQFLASWYMFFFQLPWLPEWVSRRNDFGLLVDSLRNSTVNKSVFSNEEIEEYKAAWSRPGALTATINYYRANIVSRLFSSGTESPKIAAPTLFIYGEKDHAILPETVAGVGDAVSGRFEEHRIPNSGHWVQQEARDEVTAVLRDFLAR
jgi:pimeloyl-ACP methyl ester carboxylesterase